MNFQKTRRRIKPAIKKLSELYPFDLQFYKTPPSEEISLHEFEKYAINRLKVLRTLEQIFLRRSSANLDELKVTVISELKKQGLKNYSKFFSGLGDSEEDFLTRKEDLISHFILRLAYCRSDELRRWFLLRELELFKLRWHCLSSEKRKQFLKFNELNYAPISEEERMKAIEQSRGMISMKTDYYSVIWTDVVDLVKARKVYLKNGFAYITTTEIISVLTCIYRSHLAHCLTVAARKLPVIEEDSRLHRTLHNLHNAYSTESYVNQDQEQISIDSLDGLSKKAYPLCMQQLHRTLRSEHHLRHGARQQYGLFLKGIGVSLEDALKFWKLEFTKKIDVDKFEKNYAYNIRHNYGKEGKRTNYTPHSCMKIITESIGGGDQHGCPFKHNDQTSLKFLLQSNGLNNTNVNEVMDFVSKGHFQIACTKYFEIIHGRELLDGIKHPNQYFSESMKSAAGAIPIVKVNSDQKGNEEKSNNESIKMDVDDNFWDESGVDFSSIDANVDAEKNKA